MRLTIFTPAYNRAHTLPRLYESLAGQTSGDFEWLVVDDGSRDGTGKLVEGWAAEGKIAIRYVLQPNGGKHRAVNSGVEKARGKLFFMVDSDDYLSHDRVVEQILEWMPFLEEHPEFCAVVGNKVFEGGRVIGTERKTGILDSNFVEYRERYGIKGDRAEVVKTEAMREFPFPSIEGEKFCSERYIWTDLARKYRARYLDLPFVTCEYREDGLSHSAIKITRNNPVGSMLGYAKYALHPDTKWFNSIRYAAYFWCYSCDSDRPLGEKIKIIGWPRLAVLPLGLLYRFVKIYILSKKSARTR